MPVNENEHIPSESVKVHGGEPKSTGAITDDVYSQLRNERKYPELQIVRDHLTKISKLAANEHFTPAERAVKLNQLGKIYSDGYPYKNNRRLDTLRIDGMPVLARQAYAQAHQLESIMKARAGKNVGQMGNQD